MEKNLQEKLFQIVIKPSKYKLHQNIVLPKEIKPISEEALFFRNNSFRILELGCGWGEFALQWLNEHPDHEYIAVEVKKERILHILKKIDQNNIKNLKIIPINFEWFLWEILPKKAFHLIVINFPDPWPKKRHWKHRVINQKNLERFYELLRVHGYIYITTDYGPYARKILYLFRNSKKFIPMIPFPNYLRKRLSLFPESKFEKITSKSTKPYFMLWRKFD